MISFRAGDLAWTNVLTVAGQRRTCTGFAFEPSHPGVKAPKKHYSIELILVNQFMIVKDFHGMVENKKAFHSEGFLELISCSFFDTTSSFGSH